MGTIYSIIQLIILPLILYPEKIQTYYLFQAMNKVVLLFILVLICCVTPQIVDNSPKKAKAKLLPLSSIQLPGQTLLQTYRRLYGQGKGLTQSNQTTVDPVLEKNLTQSNLATADPASEKNLTQTNSTTANPVSEKNLTQSNLTTADLPRRLLVEQALHNYIRGKKPHSCNMDYDNFQGQRQAGFTAGRLCNFDAWTFNFCTNEFLHVQNKFADIFPGSILKSKYFSQVLNYGPQTSQIPVKAGSDLTNPKINIYSSSTSASFTANYDFLSINKKISQNIVDPDNDHQTIHYKIGSTDDLGDFAKTLNFNPALLKKLGINNISCWCSSLPSYKKKYIMVFTKHTATYQVEIKSYIKGLQDSPLNTFFSPKMTVNQYLSHQNYNNWWEYQWDPAYIDAITYGAMIILTVDYNFVTANLYDQLMNGLGDSDEAQAILKKMLLQPSVKTFIRGPFDSIELTKLKTSNWFDWMIQVPNSLVNKQIQPMIYSVLDFNRQNYNSAMKFSYVKVCAS